MKNFLLFCLLAFVGIGCASTAKFSVSHGKIAAPSVKQTGTLALAPLLDSRGVTNAMLIGGYGEPAKPKTPLFVVKQGKPLAEVLTADFKQALQTCGYVVRDDASDGSPVLEGSIHEFWLQAGFWKAVCRTRVDFSLKNKTGGQVLWQKSLVTEEDDMMIIPAAMTAALETLLRDAVNAFSAQEFAGNIPK